MDCPFGLALKDWRQRRRMSQLDLGLVANVSARHIAFLETGRAKPSRPMVLQLSDALEMPRASRNGLLHAAGFAPVYRSRPLADDEMIHVRAAVAWTLQRHDPFPAFAIDRHWVLIDANVVARLVLERLGLTLGGSLLDAMTDGTQFPAAIENWPVLANYMASRLRTESLYLGGDPVLDRAAAKLRAVAPPITTDATQLPAVVATRLRFEGRVLSFFSTIAQFGTAEDMALADLRIELLFPADEATRLLLLAQPAPIG